MRARRQGGGGPHDDHPGRAGHAFPALSAALCLLLALSAGTHASAAENEEDRRLRLVPPLDALGAEDPVLEPGHDIERGPTGDPALFRFWTAFTRAEVEAADPAFRRLVESIRLGAADKRVMRYHWFYRSRLDPFDVRIPDGWREAAVAVLRDEGRNRAQADRFEARRFDGPVAPVGSILDTSDTLRGDAPPSPGSSSVSSGGIPARGVWVPVGPFDLPGRVTGLDRPADDPLTLYAVTADGGVWRTRDGAATWESLTDFEATQAGGSILLDPTDPSIIYYGTGEGNQAIDNYGGIGVLKSIDAGRTWSASNPFSDAVRRLAIHPDRTDRIWAAGDDGCYVSLDAGVTFNLVDPSTGLPSGTPASTVLVRPDDADTVYCALWGGADSGIWRTTDGGDTWAAAETGLPAGDKGRIALAISRSDPAVMLAGLSLNSGQAYRTDDGGDTWTGLGGDHVGYCGSQCWYDNAVGIDPADPAVLYVAGINVYRSMDAGATWEFISSGVHVDHHDVLTPAPGELLLATDGGIYRSVDSGSTWADWGDGMDTAQYYGICDHPADPYWVFGGTQDNGSHRRRTGDVPEWQMRLGGDGGMCLSGPAGSDVVIGEYQNMNVRRSLDGGRTFYDANTGIPWEDPKSWVGILVANRSDRNQVWAATNRLYRSLDARSTPWVPVSDPLWFDLQTTALEVASSDGSIVWAGFTSGGLFRSTDALAAEPAWSDVRDESMPMRSVRRIRSHPEDASTAYVVFSGYGAGKIWKSADGGATWADRTGDLPDVPVNDLLVDPASPGTILAATDLGVFRTDDDGTTWYGFSTGLPTVASIEFTYDQASGTLRLGTHGRSMWEWQASSSAPVAVPDGSAVPGAAMTVDRIGASSMRVRWDVRACTAHDYNLLYGDLTDVATRAYSGAECGLGTAGTADLPLPVTPTGNAFFVVVATDGAGAEGPHGFDPYGDALPANGFGFCGVFAQVDNATCP